MAVRLITGFRTISEDAALALAGLPPIDLDIKALSLRHTSGCWVSGRTDGKRRDGGGGLTSSSLSCRFGQSANTNSWTTT